MKKIIIILIIGLFITGIVSVSTFSDQYVDAGSTKKVHFTQTITSSQDPGLGHENHQLAVILSPNEGTIYDGSMTFTSSDLVNVVVLHEINQNDVQGQDTWTVNENTIYGFQSLQNVTDIIYMLCNLNTYTYEKMKKEDIYIINNFKNL